MDRNGKISLSTNKSKVQSTQKDLNTTIRKELGLMEYKKMIITSPNKNQGNNKLIRNARAQIPIRNMTINKPRPIINEPNPLFRSNLAMDTG